MAQIEVLQTVHHHGTVRLGDLAARLNLAQSTVSTLVGRLIADGLVARTVDPRDRRAAMIALTPAGGRNLRDWDDAHRRRLARALDALLPPQRRRITSALPALGDLVHALETQTERDAPPRSR